MSMKKRSILVADQDLQLLKLMQLRLRQAGFEVLIARDGLQTLELFEQNSPNLLILEISIPRATGLEICRRLREFSAVPIIFVSAREQLHDKLEAFRAGGDDFLSKPFEMEELLARMQAVLRRLDAQHAGHLGQSALTIGNLTIDYLRQQVRVGDHEILLTPIEYSLLSYLARHAGQVLTHHQLLEHTWGHEYTGEQHLLHVNISRLRQKLEPGASCHVHILTRPGIGYMLVSRSVRPTASSAAYEQLRHPSPRSGFVRRHSQHLTSDVELSIHSCQEDE